MTDPIPPDVASLSTGDPIPTTVVDGGVAMHPSPLLQIMIDAFNNTPFHKHIGLRLERLSTEELVARFEMRPELIGNYWQSILHGGVIASVLDTVGGFMGMVSVFDKMRREGVERNERMKRLNRLGTIDMRIDYLKPGRGEWFLARGTLLRAGNKVLTARMELSNNKGEMIAVGTGSYLY